MDNKEVENQIAEGISSRIGLIVGLPCSGRPTSPDWGIALATFNYPTNLFVMILGVKGKPIADARTDIINLAIQKQAKYIFFLDDDVVAPMTVARKLIFDLENNEDAMIATGIYPTKTDPAEPVIYRGDGQGALWKWKAGTVFEIDGCGAGCMMINTEVFKHIEPPYFKWAEEDHKNPRVYKFIIGEDLYFCKKVKNAGFKILADGGVLCEHYDVEKNQYYALSRESFPFKGEELEMLPDPMKGEN